MSIPGIGAAERHQVARQPIADDRLARLHRQGAALEAAKLRQHQFRRFGARQHRPSLRQEDGSGLGQLDTPADAMEQLGAVPRFQRRDRGAGRRLRQMQRLGRPRDMLAFGDGDKDAKLVECHGVNP